MGNVHLDVADASNVTFCARAKPAAAVDPASLPSRF
jgi:hypothetical protein